MQARGGREEHAGGAVGEPHMTAASNWRNRGHGEVSYVEEPHFMANSERSPSRLSRKTGCWRKRSTLVCLACLVCIWHAPQIAQAQKGYDKEENPTGLWTGYCLPLEYKQAVGLCAGYQGSPKVCAASVKGANTKSATYWHDEEIFNIRAPHTEKSLLKGTQAFETLQLYLVNWACRQIGDNIRPRTGLSPDDFQEAACNFVWRRDQEIQNNKEDKNPVPAHGMRWGTFKYQPPGKNETTFMFKGIPRQQCKFDFECRGLNTPGDVYTACEFCESYFNKYCSIDTATVFQFCMEKVHCVCNSVLKPCAKPRKDRCPVKDGVCTALS
jgi:hypothetical protein